jgi:hypothetical protein
MMKAIFGMRELNTLGSTIGASFVVPVKLNMVEPKT